MHPSVQWLRRNPVFAGALTGILLFAMIALGLLGPVRQILREGHTAETERLLDAFEEPIAASLAKGDDLSRIDELRRLQKLPGVISSQTGTESSPKSFDQRILVWEGKRIGLLKVQLSWARWRRLRYHWMERIWTLAVLMGLGGALAGILIEQRQNQLLKRFVGLRKLCHKRHRSHWVRLLKDTKNELLPWTHQAVTFASDGLILLDSRQKVMALNHPAQEWLQLQDQAIGKHWLDIEKSPEWAQVIQQSIEHPGVRVSGPDRGNAREISVVTMSPNATWIVFRQ